MSTSSLGRLSKKEVVDFLRKSGTESPEALFSEKQKVDAKKVEEFVNDSWDNEVFGVIEDYVRVENQSPDFDPHIYTNGFQEKALKLLVDWASKSGIEGMHMEVCEEKDMTPFVFIEVDKSVNCATDDTVLLYGHFDKQPPVTEAWDAAKGLHPYKPKVLDGKLYGRGAADDGYALFAALDSIRALQRQGAAHPRCVVTVEGCEESGSAHLDIYLERFKARIGTPTIVVCLDSGCGNYEQLWLTSSLRGILIAHLSAQLLAEGIHSGASGKVRDSFHILRRVLDRFDDAVTGECKIPELCAEIPASHRKYAEEYVKVMGEGVWTELPLLEGCEPQLPATLSHATELQLNGTWRPQLSITGCEGIPGMAGGNVLRPMTKLKLSIRLPPVTSPDVAFEAVKKELERDPPFGAKVILGGVGHGGGGFCAPDLEPWLMEAVQSASRTYYKKPALFFAEGGSIPLMGQLARNFPLSQFVVTGVLGPGSNAHGPNEFLHMAFTKKLVCCIANILNAAATHEPSAETS